MVRLAIFAFSKRWGWLVAGLIVLAFGGVLFARAHAIVPTEMSGTLSSAKDILQNSTYDHTEVQLAGDTNTYTFNKNDMTPSGVTDAFYKDGKIDIWIDQGTTAVVALQLYGQNDNTPTKYASDVYTNPDHALSTGRTNGEIIGGFGALLLLIGLVWPLFPWARKRAPQKQPEMASVGYGAQANLQNAYGRPEPGGAYSPQQPGYGQQPAQQPGWAQQQNQPPYGPPNQYGQQNPSQYPQPGQYGQPGMQSGWGQQNQPPYGPPAGGEPPRSPDQGGWGR